ncbi:MAG: hypothetical protein WCP36_05880 [Methanomicrobiales archaeon]
MCRHTIGRLPSHDQGKIIRKLRVVPGKGLKLKNFGTGWTQNEELKRYENGAVKERATEIPEVIRVSLASSQELPWDNNTHSVLVILQGMDTAGKDGTIRRLIQCFRKQAPMQPPGILFPADYRWVARTLLANIISTQIQVPDLKFPGVSPEQPIQIGSAREQLKNE